MGPGHFGFALFIFALVCVAIFFAWMLFSSSRARNKRVNEREKSLLLMHRDIEETVTAFKREADARLEALRRFAETSDALMSEMRTISSVSDEQLDPVRELIALSEKRTAELRRVSEATEERLEAFRSLAISSDERVESLQRLVELTDERLEAFAKIAANASGKVEELRTLHTASETLINELKALAASAVTPPPAPSIPQMKSPASQPAKRTGTAKKAMKPPADLLSVVESLLDE